MDLVDPWDNAQAAVPPRARPTQRGSLKDPLDDAPKIAPVPIQAGGSELEEFSAFGDTPGLMELMERGEVSPDQVSPFALVTDPIFKGANNFLKLLTTMDGNAQADILNKSIPGSTVEPTEAGPVLVLPNGERRAINERGLSQRDIIDFGATLAKFIPAGRLASGVTGTTARVAVGGAASGATSVAEDLAAGAVGSEQGVSGSKAAVSVAGGAAGEVLAPLLRAVGSTSFGKATGKFASEVVDRLTSQGLVIEGTLTPSGVAFIRSLGLNPSQISKRLGLSLEQFADGSVDPKFARAAAESEAFNVPLTKGEATGDFAQKAMEESVRRSDRTTEAGNILRQAESDQQAALIGLDENTGAGLVQSELSGGNRILDAPGGRSARATIDDRIGQAGDALVESGARKAEQLQAGARAAYNEAAERGAAFTPESAKDGLNRVIRRLKSEDPDMDLGVHAVTPQSAKTVNRLNEIVKSIEKAERFIGARKGGKLKAIDLRFIEMQRRKLNRAWGAAKSDDKRIIRGAIDELDAWMDGAVDSALVSGDESAIEALKRGRSMWSQLQSQFRGKDSTGKLLGRLADRDVTATELVNGVFGAGQIGGKQGTVKALETLKGIFGEESSEWMMVREAAWLRVLSRSVKRDRFGVDSFLSAYDEAFSGKGRDVMKLLYSANEIKLMDEFRTLVARIEKQPGVANPSGTSSALIGAIQGLLPRLGNAIEFGAGVPGASAITAAVSRRSGKKIDWEEVLAGVPRNERGALVPRVVAPAAAVQIQDGQ